MTLAFVLAIVVPLILGLLVGWLSFYHGSTPLYASVISLVLPIVVTQLVFAGGVWTGSSSGLEGYDVLPLSLEGYFRLAGVCLVVVAFAAWVFVRSDAGHILIAIRDNEMRSAYLGLNTQRIKIVLTAVLAGVAGLAGFLYANASGVVAPENTGFVFGTQLVIWTALGGRGTILGPIIGALAIDYLSANLSGDLPFLWQLIVGGLFVIMIIILPNGLAALPKALFGRRGRRAASGAGAPILLAAPESGVAKAAADDKPLLSVRQLTKSFGSHRVLQGHRSRYPPRRTGQPGRTERRRQDDADALPERRHPGDYRHGNDRCAQHRRPDPAQDRPPRGRAEVSVGERIRRAHRRRVPACRPRHARRAEPVQARR